MMLSDLIDALQDTLDNEGDMPVYGQIALDAERFEIAEITIHLTEEIVTLCCRMDEANPDEEEN